uniref:Plant heme peroxidase family profile domain-containing protein n=1 Tax=Arcella intermedia TaxID=1963864 RepID=A0A6B2L7K2_9EUKA
MTCDVYNQAYLALDKLISRNSDILPTLVRAAFHDCVGASCDGCMNFDDPHNAGLSDAIEVIDQIFEGKGFDQVMSRSDWWQLAAHVALIRGGLNQGCDHHAHCTFFELQFSYGRKDCSTSPVHRHVDDAGSAHGDYEEVWRVLHGNFGLDHHEVVALLGAHSLGGADRAASGFNYDWQEDSLVFDNQYFKNLITLPYQVEDVSTEPINGSPAPLDSPHLYQFTSPVPHNKSLEVLMLNTDMALLKDIRSLKDDDDAFTGVTTCKMGKKARQLVEDKPAKVRKCNDAPTAPLVYKFAEDLEFFYETFTTAYWKMVSHGNEENLNVPSRGDCGHCIPEGAFCVAGFEKSGQCCPGSQCVKHKCTSQYY